MLQTCAYLHMQLLITLCTKNTETLQALLHTAWTHMLSEQTKKLYDSEMCFYSRCCVVRCTALGSVRHSCRLHTSKSCASGMTQAKYCDTHLSNCGSVDRRTALSCWQQTRTDAQNHAIAVSRFQHSVALKIWAKMNKKFIGRTLTTFLIFIWYINDDYNLMIVWYTHDYIAGMGKK